MEDHDLIDTIEELGPEVILQDAVDRVARHLLFALPQLVAQVGGHDHDRVAEVHRAALAVGETAIVKQLQQDVEHFVVGLLDLVEQHHAVLPAADSFRQLTALLIPDIARRRADQA